VLESHYGNEASGEELCGWAEANNTLRLKMVILGTSEEARSTNEEFEGRVGIDELCGMQRGGELAHPAQGVIRSCSKGGYKKDKDHGRDRGINKRGAIWGKRKGVCLGEGGPYRTEQ